MRLHANARHVVRLGNATPDRAAAGALRDAAFRGGAACDADAFDPLFRPLLVSLRATGTPVACARVRVAHGAAIGAGYTAAFYDLAPVAERFRRCIEIGRLCTAPGADALVLQSALAGIAALARAAKADLLFGCTSLAGTDRAALGSLLAGLGPDHVAPRHWRPGATGAERIPLPAGGTARGAPLPPLLRLYLGLGAVVSDHAVIDRDLGTCHLFTALPVTSARPAGMGQRIGASRPA